MTAAHSRLASRAALAAMTVALALIGLKGFAAAQTGSVAMLGSLADTVLDLAASVAAFWAIRIAARPADHDHRFGHGKAEALAALLQVGLITASAIAILWRSATRLHTGAELARPELGLAASALAIAVTGLLLAYQRRVIALTGSIAIKTDYLHYKADLLLNVAVIAALALGSYGGFAWLDPLFGAGVALMLLWGALRAVSEALDQLMDKEWSDEKRRAFLAAAAEHPCLEGLHDFRTRTSGNVDFVQFHVWLDGELPLRTAHDRVEEAEHALRRRFPGTEIIVHLDPAGHVDMEGNLPSALAEQRPA